VVLIAVPKAWGTDGNRYFCEWIITPYLHDGVHGKFIDKKVLDKYWDVGGVRIEDDILVLGRGKGNENLTTAPRC
jgi:Xaa-Pro dipeptidase